MKLAFSKMHGLGNDFMVLDATVHPFQLSATQIQALSDRHFGVGFDQLLVVEASDDAKVDFNYRIFNASGDEVGQCGNGARALMRFIRLKKLSAKKNLIVKTHNQTLQLTQLDNDLVKVSMGVPQFAPQQIPLQLELAKQYHYATGDEEIIFSALSMGNPHAVILVNDVNAHPIERDAASLAQADIFPQGVNVGFMQIQSAKQIKLRVIERGCGETLACGSGACAAVVAGIVFGKLAKQVDVDLPGGRLQISWENETAPVKMTGPATHVFDGVIELERLPT